VTDASDARNAEICKLADEGMSRADLSRTYGVTKARITQIVTRGREQETSERVTELKRKYHDLEGVARKPPAQHSAIGKIIYDETGEVVRNESVRVAAVREQRQLLREMRAEEDRKEVASDAEQQEEIRLFIGYLSEVVERNERLERLLARYEREGFIPEAEIVPDLSPDALPSLVAMREAEVRRLR
jgi:hypothetical protein